jgi:hypothetical protein
MLTPKEIVETALSRWPAVLRAEASGENLFPLRIPFGKPRTTTDFKTLRHEIELLAAAPYKWQIDWEEIKTRKWGRQRWPMRVSFNSVEDMASALGCSADLKAFRSALRTAREACPALGPWLLAKAHRVPDYLTDWAGLVSVCTYFAANPRPRCFARQIPLPIGTKFIEEHTGILRELLDVVLGDRVNNGATSFEERFHLLQEPPQVRFRFLDPDLHTSVGWPVMDCSIPAPTLAQLTWNIPHVLVVENRDVFLCLPSVPKTLAIFGSGKAASVLPACSWLNTADILYWGDCDEAGYAILSTLRSRFSHVRSLLMDETAWDRWKHLAIPGKRDPASQHLYLTAAERSALNAVLAGPWMLEQERIPPADAEHAILAMLPECP